MHEIGLCESFLDAVERRADGRRVTGVRLRIGALHRVVEPALAQAFAMVSTGTVAEGAAVELVTVPVRLACASCERESEGTDPLPLCPGCGAPDPKLVAGDELILESIRVAEGVSDDVPRDSG
ncbi:MAG TPA: hydrogenase maturation nickel metallochaperone HypA [Planosporangium sp.]|jgi:hydrogenase nickel incorporation protein HypA/HybF|nr:hydrogenase maturation nickel metallochaperone HypA [Planosporangium sp.]